MKFHWLVSLALATTAAADTPPPVPPELLNCAAIGRNNERLACFDRAVAALAAGKPAGGPAATPEATFGMLSSTPAPTRPADSGGDLQSLQSTVKAFGRADDGSLLIKLENGQAWKQISGTDPLLRKGDTVTINRAALGSFQMIMPSGRSAKVRRVD